jgi:hypothetical protein
LSNDDKKFLDCSAKARTTADDDVSTYENVLDQLHPSLIGSFVPLPPAGIKLTIEQLNGVFDGDVRALSDIARLAYQTRETDPKL